MNEPSCAALLDGFPLAAELATPDRRRIELSATLVCDRPADRRESASG